MKFVQPCKVLIHGHSDFTQVHAKTHARTQNT